MCLGARRFISILLLLLSAVVYGQPLPYKEKPRKIKLPKYFKAYLPPKTLPFSAVQVIQTVWDSTTIGFIQKGAFNITAEAVPAKELTPFLQEYVTTQYKDYFKKGSNHVLLAIKNLRVTEKTFFSRERAYLLLTADAYISSDGNLYKLAASMDSTLIMQGMTDVTSLHGENLVYGILELLKQCLANGQNVLNSTTEALTVDQVRQKNLAMYDIPVLKAGKINEGAYMSFEEFRENTPSVLRFEVELESKKSIRVQRVMDDSSRIEIKPWGVCKEGEMYLFREAGLIPLEKKGNGFVISDYLEKSQRRNLGIAFGALLGGIGGGLIGGIGGTLVANATSEKLLPVTQFTYIPKQQPDASTIDLRTGQLTF